MIFATSCYNSILERSFVLNVGNTGAISTLGIHARVPTNRGMVKEI
jgi:hypothetical protein